MDIRDKYGDKLASLLDNWNAGFDELEKRIAQAGADPGLDYDEVITALRQHRYKTGAPFEETMQHGKDTR